MKYPTYGELRGNLANDERIPYRRLLQTKEWIDCRERIIKRDNFICVQCKKHGQIKIASAVYLRQRTEQERKELFEELMFNGVTGKSVDAFVKYELSPSQDRILHVHHTYYDLELLPWEYAPDALQTLCVECHQKVHEHTHIPVYRGGVELTNVKVCDRCNGSGYIPEFSHYMDGICFECDGERFVLT